MKFNIRYINGKNLVISENIHERLNEFIRNQNFSNSSNIFFIDEDEKITINIRQIQDINKRHE